MNARYYTIKKERVIIYVLAFAFLLRILVLLRYGLDITLNSDDMGYVRSSMRFLETGMLTYHYKSLPTVHIMPGQTLLLSTVFLIFGSGDIGLYFAKIVMIGIGILGIYGTYLTGKYIYNTEAGLLASSILTISLPQIVTDNLLLTETPFMTSLIFLVYYSFKLSNSKSMKDFYFLTTLYVFAIMLRPTIALYPFLLLPYYLLKKYPIKLIIKQATIACIILLTILTPWWIRNYKLYNEFIPFTGGQGNPLLLGTFQGEGYPNDVSLDELLGKIKEETPGDIYYTIKAQEKVAKERIAEWWESDKKSFLKSYLYLKPKLLWNYSFYWIKVFDVKSSFTHKFHRVCLIAGIIGFITMLKNKDTRKEAILIFSILLYFTALYAMYYCFGRYNQPLLPLVDILIGVGICNLLSIKNHLLNDEVFNKIACIFKRH